METLSTSIERKLEAAGKHIPVAVLTGPTIAPEVALAQARRAAHDGTVMALSGKLVAVKCQSICVHSDTPGAIGVAKAIHAELT